jgi:predicted porin
LQYKSNIVTGGSDQYKRNAFSIGAKWNIATGYVGAQYIQAFKGTCELATGACNADSTGGKMVGLGYYHTLSKQTQAYVMGTFNHNDQLQFYSTAGGISAPLNYGASLWGFTVGLKHSF